MIENFQFSDFIWIFVENLHIYIFLNGMIFFIFNFTNFMCFSGFQNKQENRFIDGIDGGSESTAEDRAIVPIDLLANGSQSAHLHK